MSDRAAPRQGVMEGGGAYNQHSMVQAAGSALALPLLEDAVVNVALEPEGNPVVLADYRVPGRFVDLLGPRSRSSACNPK
jgi:hypothetical protein